MHANVHRRERQTDGRVRGYDDRARKDGQLQMHPRQRRGRTGNADRVVAGVAGFHPERVHIAVAVQFVIVVMILHDQNRRVVVMVVAMRRRTVPMLGMIMPSVRMHVHRRHRGRTGHGRRQHERKEATHDDESTRSPRMSVKSRVCDVGRISEEKTGLGCAD